MRFLFVCALAASSWCVVSQAQSPALNTRTCNLNNGNNGCLKYDELSSWLQFCPYYGQDTSIDGTDSGCIAIKPLRIAETSSTYGELALRDSSNGLRLRPDGSASVKRFDKNCSSSPYFACLPDEGSQTPIISYSLPLRMDLPQGGNIRLKAHIFGNSGVLQYGTVRHTVERNSFKFDLSCDNYVFQNQGATGLTIDFLVRDHGASSSSNSAAPDSDCGCISVNQLAIKAPQWFSFVPLEGSTYTTPTTMEPATSTSSFPTVTSSESMPSETDSSSTQTTEVPNTSPPTTTVASTQPTATTVETPVVTLPPLTADPVTRPPVTRPPTPPPTLLTVATRPPATTRPPVTKPPVTTTPRFTLFPFTLFPAAADVSSEQRRQLQRAANGRRLLQFEEPTTAAPAAYVNGRYDPNEVVMWGSTSVSVRNVNGQQALSFSFNGPFSAFHYDPFVAEANWDVSQLSNDSPPQLTVTMVLVYTLIVVLSALL